MTTPINLNKARKARAKAAREARAVENRAKFGCPKTEKEAAKHAQKTETSTLDGKKLTPD